MELLDDSNFLSAIAARGEHRSSALERRAADAPGRARLRANAAMNRHLVSQRDKIKAPNSHRASFRDALTKACELLKVPGAHVRDAQSHMDWSGWAAGGAS
jgi:hypothetical protein